MKRIFPYIIFISSLLTAYPPSGSFHDIAVDFQGTFSMINDLDQNNCSPIYIGQNDIGTSGVSLGSGIFKLKESVSFTPASPATAITLTEDDTIFDLQCFKLSQGNPQSGVNGIQINPNLSNITIRNGKVADFTNAGVVASENVNNLAIHSTRFANNARGIFLDGDEDNTITKATLNNLNFVGSTTAIELFNVGNSTFKQILALNSTQAGFDIRQSFTNSFQNTTINGVHSTSNAYGFKLENGGNNQILSTLINGISTSSTDTVNKAVGIEIGRYEFSDSIMQNQISLISSQTTSLTAGINMLYTFTALSNSGLPSQEYNQNGASNPDPGVYSVAWSPDGKYLAIGQTQLVREGSTAANITEVGIIRILQFDGKKFIEITSITYDAGGVGDPDAGVYSVAWSPDGQYLAIGQTQLDSAGFSIATNITLRGVIRILQFNGTSLTEIDSITYTGGTNALGVYSVAWSPDGRYIAIGQTRLLKFDTFGNTNYTERGVIRILQFDGTSLIEIDSITYSGGTSAPGVYSVAWSPDGRYIALGQTQLTASGTTTNFTELGIIRILQFNGTSLTETTSITYNAGGANVPDPGVYSVAWSPDGRYIALGQTQLTPDGTDTNLTELGIIRTLQFDGANLIEIDSITYNAGGANVPDPGVYSVAWSPDGRYITIGQTQLTADGSGDTNFTELGIIRTLQFDGANLIEIDSITYDANGTGNPDPGVYSVAWSPDGPYIALGQTQLTVIGPTNFTPLGILSILSSLQFSANHSIANNIISNVVGPDLALTFSAASAISSGRGMQATSNNNSIYNNRVNNSNLAYTFVASEQYLQNVENLTLSNQFPNVLSNVSNNSDYQFARTKNAP